MVRRSADTMECACGVPVIARAGLAMRRLRDCADADRGSQPEAIHRLAKSASPDSAGGGTKEMVPAPPTHAAEAI